MKTGISAALLAHYLSGTTTLCTIWTVTLTNNTVLYFTDHDQDVPYGGHLYLSTTGYTPSAVDSSSELNPDNLELAGFLSSPSITEADIHSGIWDYAHIEIAEINYLDETMGKNILRTGTLGQVKGGRTRFTAELRGLMQAYTRTIVRVTTKECTADLGDARCKINLALFTINGTVSTVDTTTNQSFTFTGSVGPGTADGYFDGGLVTWLNGRNAGLKMEVKSYQYSPGSPYPVLLVEQMPYPIGPGDTFAMSAGCSKRWDVDCRDKFNNIINFRGFKDVPGSDAYQVGGENR
jgi:uncharacterized phage protein (TIGR02218 family)